MTTAQSVDAFPALPDWDRCEDRTLYWTLSLHIDRGRLPEKFHAQFHPRNKLAVQNAYCQSATLRDAMEPLFNDIADRERLSEVGDYLLDVPGARQGEWLEITIPGTVVWTTEGTSFAAELGAAQRRLLRCRRFWYVHQNGSLSYHTSFCLKYEHTPADYYFIALLQKIVAPKECAAQRGGPGAAARPITVGDGATGLFPLDRVLVRRLNEATGTWDGLVPFWHYVRNRFDAHARDLLDTFNVRVPVQRAGRGRQPV